MLAVLGQNVRDRELLTVLADSNVHLDQDLVLVEETAQAYLEKKAEGFSLAFRDDTFEDDVSVAPARDELIFHAVFLYAEGEDGYTQYRGAIPGGIRFDDTRAAIEAALGAPSWHRKRDDGSISAERWDLPGHHIHVTYSRGAEMPTVISLGVSVAS
jgi:hypothetical protein